MTEEWRDLKKLPVGRLLLYVGFASFVTGSISTIGDVVKSEYQDEVQDCRLATDYLKTASSLNRPLSSFEASAAGEAGKKLIACLRN